MLISSSGSCELLNKTFLSRKKNINGKILKRASFLYFRVVSEEDKKEKARRVRQQKKREE